MNFELQLVYIRTLPFICKGGDGCPVPKRFVADIVTLIAKILLWWLQFEDKVLYRELHSFSTHEDDSEAIVSKPHVSPVAASA